MKDSLLLAGCAEGALFPDYDGSVSASAASDKGATACVDTSVVLTSAQETLPPPISPSALPNAPRAPPPWGIVSPAVERLQPIGLSPLQAAAYLSTSRSRVYRLLRQGRLRAIKQGSGTIILLQSLREYAASLPVASFNRPKKSAAA